MGVQFRISGSRVANKMRVQKAKRQFWANHRQLHLQAAEQLRLKASEIEFQLEQALAAGVTDPHDEAVIQVRKNIVDMRARAISEENGECMENHA